MSTYVGFDRHILQLKVKRKDEGENKYDWTIHQEYIPKPTMTSSPSKPPPPKSGLLPTTPLSESDTENLCILSGLTTAWNTGQIKEHIVNFFEEKDKDLVDCISPGSRNCAVVTCKDRQAAMKVAKEYNEKVFMGDKVKVQIFSPRKN